MFITELGALGKFVSSIVVLITLIYVAVQMKRPKILLFDRHETRVLTDR